MSDRDEKLELRELRLPAELLPPSAKVRVRLPDRLGLGCWAELLTLDREQREATAELPSGEQVTLRFTGEPGALYQLGEQPASWRAREEAELEEAEPGCRKLRESVGRELGEALSRGELLARVRRELPLPLGVRGSHVELELRAEVEAEAAAREAYASQLQRSKARAEEAERLYAEQREEGSPAWYLEESEIPGGGLGAELREALLERLQSSGPAEAHGWADGGPYLWRGRYGCVVSSGGGLDGEPESWSSYLLFLSEGEASRYLRGLRLLDVQLLAEELGEGAPELLAGKASEAAEEAYRPL